MLENKRILSSNISKIVVIEETFINKKSVICLKEGSV